MVMSGMMHRNETESATVVGDSERASRVDVVARSGL